MGIEAVKLVNIPDYWPWEAVTNTFDFGIAYTYTPLTLGLVVGPLAHQDGMRLRQTLNGAWQCDWLYREDPERGVLEYGDDYPKTKAWQKLLFWTPIISQPCVLGKEIIWGGMQEIGDSLGAPCETAGIGGQWGWQQLSYDEILPTFLTPGGLFGDVLVLRYWQAWSGGPSKGAKMWFAKGLGVIKALWMEDSKLTGFGMTLQSTTAIEVQ